MGLNDKINNAREALTDTKSRMIVIVLAVIAIFVLVVSYFKFRGATSSAGVGSAMTSAPSIVSIPGMGQPTREYAKLQEQENLDLAAEAARKGTSAMPTVVRSTYLDSGVSTDLSKQAGAASSAGCSVEELKLARSSGVNASELRCRGCSLSALNAAGFSAGELRAAGFSAKELRDAGYSIADLRTAGFGVEELAAASSAKELASSGFTVCELKKAKFSSEDMKVAGFSEDAIRGAGFGNDNKSSTGECDINKLQASRGKGIGADKFNKLGCSATALMAAGYAATEMKVAGFSASELKGAGFSVADLRKAGFGVADLHEACVSAKEAKDAGFSAAELAAVGFSVGELRDAGFSAQGLKEAGISAEDLRKAGFSAAELGKAGFKPEELKAAGYTDGELVRAGVVAGSAGSVVAEVSSCSVENLKKVRADGVKADELKKRGCSFSALKNAGFSLSELKAAGLTADELKAAGFSAGELLAANFSADELRQAGFANEALLQAGVAITNGGNSDTGVSALQDSLGRMGSEQFAGMSDQELDNFKRQQQAMMMQQANQLFSAWSMSPTQQYVQGEAATKTAQGSADNVQQGKSTPQTEAAAKAQQTALALKNSDVYKAGNVIFAVLDTEVNSDETSPVMATIIQGPLKDSKVIGNFQRVSDKLLLQFSVLSAPKLSTSIAINAVAIDPDTAKTALSSSVNNHYMLRYGTMLASSFVSGLGQAFQSAGGTSQATTVGTYITIPSLNLGQKAIVAAGNMAQQFGAAMAPNITMPPTVKVKAGVSIGLLLMADLLVPKNQQIGG